MFLKEQKVLPLHPNYFLSHNNVLSWFKISRMSIFDQYISVYNGVTDNVGTYTLLSNFLGSKRHISRILDLRAETDEVRKKAIKLSLPMATVSGWFAPSRKVEHLQRHSGFICLDIDGKDNPGRSMDEIRELLCSRNDVAYASLSVGGNGMFAILPLAYPEKHTQHFDSLKQEFFDCYGLNLDKSCRDVTRLRALSYDPNPYINESAEFYQDLGVYNQTIAAPSLTGIVGDLEKVDRCVAKCLEQRIDLAKDYDEWLRLGAALANLGENGRYYYHKLSSINPKYKYQDTDRKFTTLLKEPRRISLGSFFYWCRNGGQNEKEKDKNNYQITYKRR